MTGNTNTSILQETQEQLIVDLYARIAKLFPNQWTSIEAQETGGGFYALVNSLSQQMANVVLELQYAQKSERIATATAPELDEDSTGFYGSALLRLPGQTDASFSAEIRTNFFKTNVTRAAILAGIIAIVGSNATVRLIEPFYSPDLGGLGFSWSLDVSDTAASPSRTWHQATNQFYVEISNVTSGYALPLVAIENAITAIKAEGVICGLRVI